ncbi:MAG: patatin-like phospholipase family protein [Proteobacteria bacterium]|nr:patatin-like phospholipase family protein [Pseudomonadota bacterium]
MPTREENVLVLQGGGALGAYQAGAASRLAESGIDIDWVAGISIGSVNAAILCGNPPGQRFERLRAFWEKITSGYLAPPVQTGAQSRRLYSEIAAAEVVMFGAPGFFRPRLPLAFWPIAPTHPLGVYDTSPLAETLNRLVDFDYLNDKGPRLSVGAVDVQSGNFVYFDSRKTRIDARHIMASGALPPGFPPVEIDGRLYWDGGLVSNTPLQYVMEHTGKAPLCIFQVDVFSARGEIPESLADVQQREKDIRYSSRTRLTTDRFRYLHAIRAAASRLAEKLPRDLRDDPDLAVLRRAGPDCPITLVHLIHRKAGFEGLAKDYEFSRLSMVQHWDTGADDVARTLAHGQWKSREIGKDALQVFDLGADTIGKGEAR